MQVRFETLHNEVFVVDVVLVAELPLSTHSPAHVLLRGLSGQSFVLRTHQVVLLLNLCHVTVEAVLAEGGFLGRH